VTVPLLAPTVRPAEIKALAPERYKVQFTVSRTTYEQLREAQGSSPRFLAHRGPAEQRLEHVGDPDPPDLFYNLSVTRIRKVRVPERFVSYHEHGEAQPTRVGPADFEGVEELATMKRTFDAGFFVIDFDSAGLEEEDIPLTFQ